MLIMRAGLLVATAAFAFTTWASWSTGFPVEVAFVRGGLAFMAVSFVAYLGELVVATAPPPERAAGAPAASPDSGQPEAAPDVEASPDTSASGGWNERQAA